MSHSSQRRLVIFIPILTSLLFLTALSGIIGNSILLSNSNTDFTRSFTVNDLNPAELNIRSISIPDSIDDLQISFTINYLGDYDESDEIIDIFLAENEPPFGIENITDLESTAFYTSEILDSGNIQYRQSFYPGQNIDFLYIMFSNPQDVPLSFNVFMELTDASVQEEIDSSRVLSIVFSSISAAFFLFGSIYLWLEYFGKIDERFLTEGLDATLQDYTEKAMTWELVVTALSILLIIGGFSRIFIGEGSSALILPGIGLIVVYYNFNNRQKIEANILNTLKANHEISLQELSNEILEDRETTKKALLDAIMYSDLPAHLDLKTETVYYRPTSQSSNQQSPVTSKETPDEEKFQVASTEVQSPPVENTDSEADRPLPRCGYCDTEAISVKAQFCHACGASMSIAK